MLFSSTRDSNNIADFKTAIFKGLASDGGLYFPVKQPDLSSVYNSFSPSHTFNEIASQVTWNLLKDEISLGQAESICNNAFDFVPEFKNLTEDLSILELYHGPSAAFKDFGASFLASAMESFLQNDDTHAIILTATSGDTGSAVARAFYKKKNIDVVILYPSGRVSPLQEKQLTTLGANIHALEVEGSFDDCQRMVKEAFTNDAINSKFNLTSANSINLGRLVPQSFYYTWAWAQLKDCFGGENIHFCVPSGNFGNLTACLLANQWGMKSGHLIAATNRNNVVPEFLKTGTYQPRASVLTPSNAMDVGAPSNFERMQQIYPSNTAMQKEISGYWYSDEETMAEIKTVYENEKYFICPHTAVGLLASKEWLSENKNANQKVVTLSTAHPAKFLEIVEEALGLQPPLPKQLQSLINKEKKSIKISNTLEDLVKTLKSLF